MTTATQTDTTPAQVSITLAAIAATAATPRPSGETQQAQALRAMRGVSAQPSDPALATGGTWRLMWLALSPDNGNLAYIAHNSDGSNQFAVTVRGTVDNPTDTMEDLDVGTVVPFTAGGSPAPVAVSAGAMAAFTQVVNARGTTGTPAAGPEGGEPDIVVPPSGTTLARALAGLLASAPSTPQPTVYVTGHSLGGCIATMLASYLQAQTWAPNQPQFALVTFAAPTAGLQGFADYIDSLQWSLNQRWVNAYDVVPLAWSDLSAAKHLYPPATGPVATDVVKVLLSEIDLLRKGNVYVQPSADNASTVNGDYSLFDKALVNKTTDDFLGQVAFQHANATYLTLLGAPVVVGGPVVTGVSPHAGGGGTPVTISGSGFGPDSAVDFGPIACAEFTVDPSGTQISATAPDGAGVVDIRVTTMLGTSPAVPLGQFAYGGPAPVVVSSVTPSSGQIGKHVVIAGSGFTKEAAVHFKDVVADSAIVEPPTRIRARAPHRPLDQVEKAKTVNVTVTVGVATSPTSPADEFTYEV